MRFEVLGGPLWCYETVGMWDRWVVRLVGLDRLGMRKMEERFIVCGISMSMGITMESLSLCLISDTPHSSTLTSMTKALYP